MSSSSAAPSVTRRATLLSLLGLLGLLGCERDPRDGRHVPEGVGPGEVPDDPDPDTGDPDPDGAYVDITSPSRGEVADNPVTFQYEVMAFGEITELVFSCEGDQLHADPIPVQAATGSFAYDFTGVNYERTVKLTGYDADGEAVSQDSVRFIPDEGYLEDPGDFNTWVVRSINDTSLYPKDSTYPFCWSYYGDDCGEIWGQVWGGWYGGEQLFPPSYDCFCSGHTLEIFLNSWERYQEEMGLAPHEGYGSLTVDSVDLGDFYQHWQGYGVATYASAALAFEDAGIGEMLPESRWDEATTGDFTNLSRSTGTGHAVIFIDWIIEGGERVGLRYYGCNGWADSHPDPDDPDNISGITGPSFHSEYFYDYGGTVIPAYLFIGSLHDPASL
jgi:hypothetical protein